MRASRHGCASGTASLLRRRWLGHHPHLLYACFANAGCNAQKCLQVGPRRNELLQWAPQFLPSASTQRHGKCRSFRLCSSLPFNPQHRKRLRRPVPCVSHTPFLPTLSAAGSGVHWVPQPRRCQVHSSGATLKCIRSIWRSSSPSTSVAHDPRAFAPPPWLAHQQQAALAAAAAAAARTSGSLRPSDPSSSPTVCAKAHRNIWRQRIGTRHIKCSHLRERQQHPLIFSCRHAHSSNSYAAGSSLQMRSSLSCCRTWRAP